MWNFNDIYFSFKYIVKLKVLPQADTNKPNNAFKHSKVVKKENRISEFLDDCDSIAPSEYEVEINGEVVSKEVMPKKSPFFPDVLQKVYILFLQLNLDKKIWVF